MLPNRRIDIFGSPSREDLLRRSTPERRPQRAEHLKKDLESRPIGGSPTVKDLYEGEMTCTVAFMARMNISAARERLPEAVELARTEAVFLERYGRSAAVLVSPEQYEKLMAALEDAEDVAAFDAAMEEEGPNIPWEQVKADLGWT